MIDIHQLFTSSSAQITSQNHQVQEQIMLTDKKTSNDFKQVVQPHDEFREEVQEKLDE